MDAPPHSAVQPMAEYYKRIVATAQRKRNHAESLQIATEAICEKILRDFQNNIETAAKNFHDYAFIFAYDKRALFRGAVTYHSIILPSETALENYRTSKVRTVVECLREFFAPFEVRVGVLHGTPDDERSLWSITVHWETEEPQEVNTTAGTGATPTSVPASPAIPSAQIAPVSHKDSMDSLGEHDSS